MMLSSTTARIPPTKVLVEKRTCKTWSNTVLPETEYSNSDSSKENKLLFRCTTFILKNILISPVLLIQLAFSYGNCDQMIALKI